MKDLALNNQQWLICYEIQPNHLEEQSWYYLTFSCFG